jgi:hypothetical protein
VGPPFSTALRDPSTGERTVADSPRLADIARCERPCQCCSIPIALTRSNVLRAIGLVPVPVPNGRRMHLIDGQVHRDTHMGELCDRVCMHQALFTGSDMGHIRQRTRFISRNRTRTNKAGGLPPNRVQEG